MKPTLLLDLMCAKGQTEAHAAGDVFHSQDFDETLYMLKKGYVKRVQVTTNNEKVIELIYGPNHIFPLSQLYKKLFNLEQNQENIVYVYEAMTDIEILRVADDLIVDALENEPKLYIDLFFEAGLRLKSNINRLASNALSDDYKKLAHQVVCLADEFGVTESYNGKQIPKISVPLQPKDMAEQLHMSIYSADAIIDSLCKNSLLIVKDNYYLLPDLDLLKDSYM